MCGPTALEAGAAHVFVAVNAHTLCVEVRDDGAGITEEAMALLFRRYHTAATGTQHTGETLANIAAIARAVTVTSRHTSSAKTFERTSTAPKVVLAQTSRCVGTTVAVASLYHRLPVRHKAAQATLLLARTKETLGDVAVLWPTTSFVLVDQDNGRELLRLQKVCGVLRAV